MELLINSVGFFAVAIAVVGFYGGMVVFAWRGIQQYREDAARGSQSRPRKPGLLFDIRREASE